MKADSLKISKVFSGGGDVQYVLPHFQREYAWEKANWQTLLNDVMGLYDTYTAEKEPEHFMGALVVISDGMQNGVVPVLKLVDGQQRLTTISLMLCALGEIVKESQPGLHKHVRKLIANLDEDGDLYFKLLPTRKYGDRDAYMALLRGVPFPRNIDSRIPDSYRFFEKEFGTRIAHANLDPERLFKVLANSLQVVFISLDRGERPYEIFESLNAKGKPLSQADLVRNYIAMKLPEKRQGEIFDRYWSKIEALLQEKRTVGRSRLGELTAFLRHYLALRNGVLPNEEHVYERFRDRVENKDDFPTAAEFENEICTLYEYAQYYDRLLRPEHESDKDIQTALRRLNTLEISTAYPFLIALYEAYDQQKISKADFKDALEILENYIVRRYLTGEPTNYTNKMFPALWREISPAQLVESLRRVIVTKNYPADHRVRRELMTEPLYDRRSQTRDKLTLVLETINKHISIRAHAGGYGVLDNAPTIEHIMPQTLSDEWKRHLGTHWEQFYGDYLHTLGNLTLVTQEWNSTLSNGSFARKKTALARHALALNSEYFGGEITKWNDTAIRGRAEYLIAAILEYWPELGTPPVTQRATATKPQALTIMGQSFVVGNWRDVAFYTAQTISELVDDFEGKIAEQLPSFLDKHEFRGACRQLPNGWWIYVNLSAANIKSFCRNMMALAGISEDEWQVEEA